MLRERRSVVHETRRQKIFALKGNDRREISSHPEFEKRPVETGPINGALIGARMFRSEMQARRAHREVGNTKTILWEPKCSYYSIGSTFGIIYLGLTEPEFHFLHLCIQLRPTEGITMKNPENPDKQGDVLGLPGAKCTVRLLILV